MCKPYFHPVGSGEGGIDDSKLELTGSITCEILLAISSIQMFIFCSTVAPCRWINCEINPCSVERSDGVIVGKGGADNEMKGDVPVDNDETS